MDIIGILWGEMPWLLKGVLVALQLLFGLLSLGFIVGIMLAVMEVYGNGFISMIAVIIQRFLRGIPALVILFLTYFGLSSIVPLSPLIAAIIGLGLRSAAYQSQIFRGAIQAIRSEQMIAAQAIGMNKLKAIRYIILPQAIRLAIGPWSNEFASEIKDTSLAYTIGVVEILRRARYIITYTYGNALLIFGFCAIIYLILTRVGNTILYRLEARLWVPGFERRGMEERVR